MRLILMFLAIALALALHPAQAAPVPSAHVCAYQHVAGDLAQTAEQGFYGILQPGDHSQLDALLKAHATADLAALAVLGRWQILRNPQYPLASAARWLLKAAAEDAAGGFLGAFVDLSYSLFATSQAESILLSQGAASCPAT